jgi:RNA polymerase sigma-70 factor (ECF subfamily)
VVPVRSVPAASDKVVLERLSVDLDGGYGDFVRAHADAVYSAALRLSVCRADAEDIAQETFVRAYRALRRFEPERLRSLKARPWLLAITLNVWRNALRSAARRPASATPDAGAGVADGSPGPEARAEESEDARYLTALLRALPEHQRVPVVLHHVAGLTHVEIATVLECPVGTAKANVARGVGRLRDLARSGAAHPGDISPGPDDEEER